MPHKGIYKLQLADTVTKDISSGRYVYDVMMTLADSTIEVEVRDKATGFEVDLIPDLPPTESPERLQHERGLGLSIMREMSDGLEIESGPEGTVVHMTINSQNSNNS